MIFPGNPFGGICDRSQEGILFNKEAILKPSRDYDQGW